jgi:hypothetical protein
MSRIERVELFQVDLTPPKPRSDAIQSFVRQETPIVRLTCADGAQGTGYAYTIGTGGSSVLALLADHLAPRLLARDAFEIERLWKDLFFHTHATAVGEITSLALAAVDTALWDGSSWVNVWNWAGGDPMVRQITNEAGLYSFGGCQQLVVVPMVYGGSGAVLELTIHVWNGSGLTEVYLHEGTHGTWSRSGANLAFEESVYLYGEPNCCPCNRQYLQHTWDGSAFVQTGSAVNPTYSGTPPPECAH